DERLVLSYEVPETVVVGGPFPVGVSLQNVSESSVELVVERSALAANHESEVMPWCVPEPGEKNPDPIIREDGPTPSQRPSAVRLAPGQILHQQHDVAAKHVFAPGTCRFSTTKAFYVAEGDRLELRRARLAAPVTVTVTAAPDTAVR